MMFYTETERGPGGDKGCPFCPRSFCTSEVNVPVEHVHAEQGKRVHLEEIRDFVPVG